MADNKLETQYREEFNEARRKLVRTKYVFLAALLLWPVGLIWNGYVSLAIFGVLCTLGFVGGYIALMHYITAKKRLNN